MKTKIEYYWEFTCNVGRFFDEYEWSICNKEDDKPEIWPSGSYRAIKKKKETVIGNNGKEYCAGSEVVSDKVLYHPDCEALSLVQVRKLYPDEDILISNMENNNWDHVLKDRRGGIRQIDRNYEIVKD